MTKKLTIILLGLFIVFLYMETFAYAQESGGGGIDYLASIKRSAGELSIPIHRNYHLETTNSSSMAGNSTSANLESVSLGGSVNIDGDTNTGGFKIDMAFSNDSGMTSGGGDDNAGGESYVYNDPGYGGNREPIGIIPDDPDVTPGGTEHVDPDDEEMQSKVLN